MQPIKDAASDFLAKRCIAVTGVSRTNGSHGSNTVYHRLRDRGYDVIPVNPKATAIEGNRCYPNIESIPKAVEAVVVGTRPEAAYETMRECAALGINHVWLHRGPGPGSVSEQAAAFGLQHGIHVISGGCPLMFDPTADFVHRCMRPILTLTHSVPRLV